MNKWNHDAENMPKKINEKKTIPRHTALKLQNTENWESV